MKQRFGNSGMVQAASLLLLIFCFCCPMPVNAHIPENVELEYDSSSHVLKVAITHHTSSPESHFIKRVEIRKNGISLYADDYNSQPDRETFTYVYNVSIEDGDTFEATAICSVYGYKVATLVIRE